MGILPRHVQKIAKRLGIEWRHKTGPGPGRSPWWHGGRIVDKGGYILIYRPDHPYRTRTGYVREHRLVVEARIGRYLLPKEVVHHRDNNPANNADDNLDLLASNGQHIRETVWLGKKHKPETIEKMRASARRYQQSPEYKASLPHRLAQRKATITAANRAALEHGALA
ncbi:MAG: HNH endonuclease [Dehalococcoidia bacterium]|nr:HNH endonuclease [Dehalococcoidia bacterium]